jgi:hypothetical protein
MSNSILFALLTGLLPFKKKTTFYFTYPRIIVNNQKTPYPTGKPNEYQDATYDYKIAYPYNDPYSYQNAYQKTFVSCNKKKEKRRKNKSYRVKRINRAFRKNIQSTLPKQNFFVLNSSSSIIGPHAKAYTQTQFSSYAKSNSSAVTHAIAQAVSDANSQPD